VNRSRRLQFGIRALLAWTCALSSALALAFAQLLAKNSVFSEPFGQAEGDGSK